MTHKQALLAFTLLCLGTAVANPGDTDGTTFFAIPTKTLQALQAGRDSAVYKYASPAAIVLSLVWQAVVARRDVRLEEQTVSRGVVETVEKQSDSFLRRAVLKKMFENYVRGLMLKPRKLSMTKENGEVVTELAQSGNALNSLVAYLTTGLVVDRALFAAPKGL